MNKILRTVERRGGGALGEIDGDREGDQASKGFKEEKGQWYPEEIRRYIYTTRV